jgi:hypothetical protein
MRCCVNTSPGRSLVSLFSQRIERESDRGELGGRAAHVKRRGEVPYVYSICYNNNNNDDDNVMRVEYIYIYVHFWVQHTNPFH